MNSQEAHLKAIRDTKLYFKVIGTGEPIVILHGGPGLSHDYFLPYLEKLAENYQLIFYDQRASGKSSLQVSPQSITTDDFVEDLEAIRKMYGIEQLNLMGHSWGGFVAMRYSIKYPQNLKKLILVNSTPPSKEFGKITDKNIQARWTQEDSLQKNILLKSDAFKQGDSKAYESLYRLNFKVSVFDAANLEKINFNLHQDFKKSQMMISNLGNDKSLWNYDLHKDLVKITCPTLVLHGDYDVIAFEAQEKIQQTIPNAKLILLKDCGHFPFVEQPDVFVQTIDAFLRE